MELLPLLRVLLTLASAALFRGLRLSGGYPLRQARCPVSSRGETGAVL
jgi:hypothetical protein